MYDESVFELMLQDPGLGDLYKRDVDREELRSLLLHQDMESFQEPPSEGLKVPDVAGERLSIEVDPDGMVAFITLGQPEEGGQRVTEAEIRSELEQQRIVYGVDNSCIIRLSKNPVYHRAFIIARGQAPKHGEDSFVKYYFDVKKEMVPFEHDGIVDFKELNFVKLVKKNELLCELIHGKPGKDGSTVTGMALKAGGSGGCKLPTGKNTIASKDGKKLYASCDGEITVKNQSVHVDRVLYVDHVDSSTGNIRFIGSIYVRGRICEGFCVKATENIMVGEVIEGAEVSAGGSIHVSGGVKGGRHGFLNAGGNITSPFIEHMKVEAAANLYTSVLIHSHVDCKGRVTVLGERGCILGGSCRAREIEVSQVGNDTNIPTLLEISGVDEIDLEIDSLITDLSIQERVVAKFSASFKDVDNRNRLEVQKELLSAIYKKNEMSKRRKQLEEEILYLKEHYTFDIKIRRMLFANVTVKIEGITSKINQHRGGSVFFRANNKIVIRAYR